ncbi:hypothetical protein M0811_12155 [Anaeramoeba ignava]|uniref:CBS domain-containing protein n=1 Tax=Anaeramoeba ignava TaxID=1746090 RepID=A0A9Q0R7L3_ANAIG|nr:hypothetical protein M0811_12155 [Anaeramoeba ignava]
MQNNKENKEKQEKKEIINEPIDELDFIRRIIANFLRLHKCYDLIPQSGKVVVIDTNLRLKYAFQALAEQQYQSAPLWDSENNKYIGMLTVTDVVDIVCYFYEQKKIHEMNNCTISQWRKIKKMPGQLISIYPQTRMFDAIKQLSEKHFHRLPIIDPDSPSTILYVIKHIHVLRFVVDNLELIHPALNKTLGEFKIGRFDSIISVTSDQPLIEVLRLLSEKRISGVPVVSENNELVDVFSRSDITDFIVNESLDDLNISISEALAQKRKRLSSEFILYSCTLETTIREVILKIAEINVSRLVCIDKDNKVIGVISITDLLEFFIV